MMYSLVVMGSRPMISCHKLSVPMISWPFFFEKQTNGRYYCTEWGLGMEIDSNVEE